MRASAEAPRRGFLIGGWVASNMDGPGQHMPREGRAPHGPGPRSSLSQAGPGIGEQGVGPEAGVCITIPAGA